MSLLNEECWYLVFSLLDAPSLVLCGNVCQWWRSLANDDLLWKNLCARLWEGKQNMKLEKWVRLPEKLESIGEESSFGDLAHLDEEELSRRIAEAKERHVRAENELADLVRRLQMNVLQQREHRRRFHQHRGHHAIMADAPPHDEMEIEEEEEEEVINEDGGEEEGEGAEGRNEEIHVGDAGADNLDEVHIHLTFQEIIRLQNLSDEVREARLQFFHLRDMSRLSSHPDLRPLFKRSAAPLSICAGELSSLLQKNGHGGASVEDLDLLQQMNKELSWRQSYFASLADARRVCPYYTELEGDWCLHFGQQREIGRFVQGGRHFIDNRGFSNREGHIRIVGDRLYISGIGHVVRRTGDWGWLLEGDNGFVNLMSMEHSRPVPEDVTSLRTPLRQRFPNTRNVCRTSERVTMEEK